MQGMRSCRTGPVSCPPDLKDPRDLTSEKARCPAERPVREGGKVEGAGDGADVGDCGCDGAVLGQANVTLGVEAETKQDASFMSFLRCAGISILPCSFVWNLRVFPWGWCYNVADDEACASVFS